MFLCITTIQKDFGRKSVCRSGLDENYFKSMSFGFGFVAARGLLTL